MVEYNKITPEIAEQLKAIVGEKRFFVGDAINPDYSHDEMPIYGKFLPEAVCEVESTQEVSSILKLCSEKEFRMKQPVAYSSEKESGCGPDFHRNT